MSHDKQKKGSSGPQDDQDQAEDPYAIEGDDEHLGGKKGRQGLFRVVGQIIKFHDRPLKFSFPFEKSDLFTLDIGGFEPDRDQTGRYPAEHT